ncbi:MAG: tetratricopeptide repeat protein [Spirochaetes bacterium]|nr:tetratricopeptide repeat protein [Spirochaetota bacterium]
MDMLPILLAVLALAVTVSLFLIISSRKSSGASKKRSGDNASIISNAEKRLAANPNDAGALYSLADALFEEQKWEKALKHYETLVTLMNRQPVPGTDVFSVHLRYGICAQKQGDMERAQKGFSVARSMNPNNFEANYWLGVIEFDKKNYEKAVAILQKARAIEPENPAALRSIGHALFRMKKAKEAMTFIRKAIDLAPDDKESLYTLAECYSEAKQTEQALRIFDHLRGDPVMGPSACLAAGAMRMEIRQYDGAIADFSIGLRHQHIKVDTLAELRYRLALSHIQKQEVDKAMPYLRLLQAESPSYKDVNVLLSKYQELNANRNMQVFLMAPSPDFVALCRRLVMAYFPKSKVKITNISVHKNEWADLLCEVDSIKWQELIMFRFIRTQGSIGELVVRDFHSHIKEVKAGKGVCITVGAFSEEAKRYTEARLIDLIEKERLSAMLNAVDRKSPTSVKK